jgi:hypothetical protein
MDRAILLRNLARAEAHVAQGERHIERQHEIIAALDRSGFDAGSARRTLALFEDLQRLHVGNRERLFYALSEDSQRVSSA